MATTYIIQGKSGRYYIGSTDHFEQRMNQHLIGHCHTTKRLGLPIQLIAKKEFETSIEALRFEKFLKSKKNSKIAIFLMNQG